MKILYILTIMIPLVMHIADGAESAAIHERKLVQSGSGWAVFVSSRWIDGVQFLDVPVDASRDQRVADLKVSDLRQAAIRAEIEQAEQGIFSRGGIELRDEQKLSDAGVCPESVVHLTAPHGVNTVYVTGYELREPNCEEFNPFIWKLIWENSKTELSTKVVKMFDDYINSERRRLDEDKVVVRIHDVDISKPLEGQFDEFNSFPKRPKHWIGVIKELNERGDWRNKLSSNGDIWITLETLRNEPEEAFLDYV